MSLIPPELSDFAMWLNPTNLRVFNKWETLKLARSVLRTKTFALTPEVQQELSEGLENTPYDRGLFALRVYFFQLLIPEPISLDLRPSRFYFDEIWHFHGVHLAHGFSDDLRLSLLGTYETYYRQQGKGLEEHLDRMGLMSPNWNKDDRAELERLFLNHFQQDSKTKQHFRISDLMHSFSEIFFFIKETGGKIPSEFTLLGVYLTSLYMTLEGADEPMDVQSCFERAQQVDHQRSEQ